MGYRQLRPNPYLAVSRDELDLHFAAVPGFVPEESYGSVILAVPDTGAVYEEFAAALRSAYGRLPLQGIPKITRPRRKQGTPGGFSVVDPGGNWLRITARQDEPDEPVAEGPFDRALRTAARQADARGDETNAIAVLDAALTRHPDTTAAERLPVHLYLAELLIRTGDTTRARALLTELSKVAPAEVADLTTQLPSL
ncbi:tetratricopeptide repeat protein [Kribbella sp. NPDC023972]|uniref:tetratricopeptide repeat protein n=1 Tax=Kribbella sp. NPDC023972 TaxID=3154795 RepID=UPI0034073E72